MLLKGAFTGFQASLGEGIQSSDRLRLSHILPVPFDSYWYILGALPVGQDVKMQRAVVKQTSVTRHRCAGVHRGALGRVLEDRLPRCVLGTLASNAGASCELIFRAVH